MSQTKKTAACPAQDDHQLAELLAQIQRRKTIIDNERAEIYRLAIAAEKLMFRTLDPEVREGAARSNFIAGLCYINWSGR